MAVLNSENKRRLPRLRATPPFSKSAVNTRPFKKRKLEWPTLRPTRTNAKTVKTVKGALRLHDQIILSRTTQNFVFFFCFPKRGRCPRFRGERASDDFAQKWRDSPRKWSPSGRPAVVDFFFFLASTSRLTTDKRGYVLTCRFRQRPHKSQAEMLSRRHNVNDKKMKACNNYIHKAL